MPQPFIRRLAREILESGRAAAKLEAIIEAQGRNQDPPPLGSLRHEVPAQVYDVQPQAPYWHAEVGFLARDVPSLGYRVYEVRPGAGASFTSASGRVTVSRARLPSLYSYTTVRFAKSSIDSSLPTFLFTCCACQTGWGSIWCMPPTRR